MKQKFNAAALDQLLNQSMQNISNINEQLKQDSKNSTLTPFAMPFIDSDDEYDQDQYQDEQEGIISNSISVNPDINKMIKGNQGQTVDYNRVYSQLQRLIQQGNIALQVLNAIDPDVSGVQVASATATLMNAVRGCVAEFTKIHSQHIRYQQSLETMRIKHEYRIEQMKLRSTLYNKNKEQQVHTEQISMVPWETQSILGYLKFLDKNKESK